MVSAGDLPPPDPAAVEESSGAGTASHVGAWSQEAFLVWSASNSGPGLGEGIVPQAKVGSPEKRGGWVP